VRLDKWLWAARFFKTRTLATHAVDGGKVKLNGDNPKPAKEIRPGDQLEIRIGQVTFNVTVRGLSDRRGPAPEAQLLYEESEESCAARAIVAEQMRANAAANPFKGRPTKKARRHIVRFTDS
jgi:ribosome-associated heat shock protein Hsp15